jgi:hypothetical protein
LLVTALAELACLDIQLRNLEASDPIVFTELPLAMAAFSEVAEESQEDEAIAAGG